MQSLSSTLASFRLPNLTPEEWEANDREVDEWRAAQEEANRKMRVARTGVPRMFREADIAKCDEAVRRYAGGDRGTGLLLQGTYGSGKTYAACAVLLAVASEQKAVGSGVAAFKTARFVLMDDLLRECKATFNGSETEEEVVSRYANADVLCIDDLGKERLTEWSLPILFSIVNGRYVNGRPTIVTTNYRGVDLLASMTVNGDETTAKAIISRMSTYERVVLQGGDRRVA